jgi:3-dehydroquinate dehydratase-2
MPGPWQTGISTLADCDQGFFPALIADRGRANRITQMAHSILIINGPNLNLLGTRQPEVYGSQTLADVEALCVSTAKRLGADATCFQSNHEGAIIDTIQAAKNKHNAIVINPGAYSHTSIAIRDAFSGIALPVWEIHISNIHAREEFRHHSYISAIAKGVICGCGIDGYRMAVEAAIQGLGNAR